MRCDESETCQANELPTGGKQILLSKENRTMLDWN
jgi:hypothetical protein